MSSRRRNRPATQCVLIFTCPSSHSSWISPKQTAAATQHRLFVNTPGLVVNIATSHRRMMAVRKKTPRSGKTAIAASRRRTREVPPRKAKAAKAQEVEEQQKKFQMEPGEMIEPDDENGEASESDADMDDAAELHSMGLSMDAMMPKGTNICVTCMQTRKPEDMIKKEDLPESCRNCYGEICKECMEMYFDRYFFSVVKNHILRCPCCMRGWDMSSVQHIIGKLKMEVYLERMTHRALETSSTFRWCAADTCSSGQFYDQEQLDAKGGEKICCAVCESENCFSCRAVWHEGLSCDEYQDPDLRKNRAKRAGDVEVRKAMRKADTKRCPNCGTAIERTMGCDSVFCTSCGNYFNFESAARI